MSAIPAGCGKSTSIQAFGGALASSAAHEGVGMMIAVGRLEEARDMADALQAHRGRLCVVCSDASITAMGDHATADGAQLVITTQAALRQSLKAVEDFGAVARFRFQGERRAVVVWDEAIAMNRGVCLDAASLLDLHRAIEAQSPEALDAMLQWRAALPKQPAGMCVVPDFATLGVDFARLEAEVDRDELVGPARALAVLSGGRGFVVRDNRKASGTMVAHVPELPVSLLPAIVTDASAAEGVHHVLYRQMARDGRFRVVRLKEAPKTYGNMTVRLVPTAASRSAYRDRENPTGRDLIDTVVRYVRSVAPEEVLVVGYKGRMTMKGVRERTIREAVLARLTEAERRRVHFIHWGAHTSINHFRDLRRVLLAGLNFLPPASAHAASGAALNKPMGSTLEADHPTTQDVEDMGRGMLRDSAFQALLRGHARQSVGSDCGEMEAVVFQSPQTGLKPAEWAGMFPGASIEADTSLLLAKPLRGSLKKLAEVVQGRLEDGATEMSDSSVYGAAQIDRSNYAKLKAKPEWQAWLAMTGLYPARLAGGVNGLRKAG